MSRSVSVEENIFSLEQVEVTYTGTRGPRRVLQDVSFALAPGQRIGLYGPNGSGKTTLFRCITGLVRPSKGLVRFHGKALHDEKGFHALRCKVGFVLQHADDQLFFPTVLEDVAFGPLNLGLSAAEAGEQARATLQRLGLSGFEQRLTHHLSGGEKNWWHWLRCWPWILRRCCWTNPPMTWIRRPASGSSTSYAICPRPGWSFPMTGTSFLGSAGNTGRSVRGTCWLARRTSVTVTSMSIRWEGSHIGIFP